MENIEIVGHRGLRGPSVENTKDALLEAQAAGADAVEFDIRVTKDKVPVLCHNRNLKKIYGIDANVDELDFANVPDAVPSLKEVLKMGIKIPLLLDVKDVGSADIIYKTMSGHANWMVTTFRVSEATRFRQLDKNLVIALSTVWHPFETIKIAQSINAQAITINAMSLNIFDYWKARRAGLRVMLYMNYLPFLLTTPLLVRMFRRLYPGVIICTDRPDKIVPAIRH